MSTLRKQSVFCLAQNGIVCQNDYMFGSFDHPEENQIIKFIEFRAQDDSRYRSANEVQGVVIDTPLGRVYIDEHCYFANVPESAWKSSFAGEKSPEEFLKERIGKSITQYEINEFQSLLNDLIDAEFNSKTRHRNI